MASINITILIGNLGADPLMRYMPNGKPVCTFSVATTDKWKDKQSGEPKEKTEWHRIVLFNRLAEVAGEFLHKGSQVGIEGKLRTRKWTDKNDGIDRYTTEIIGSELQMLGKKPASETPSVSMDEIPDQDDADYDNTDLEQDIPL